MLHLFVRRDQLSGDASVKEALQPASALFSAIVQDGDEVLLVRGDSGT